MDPLDASNSDGSTTDTGAPPPAVTPPETPPALPGGAEPAHVPLAAHAALRERARKAEEKIARMDAAAKTAKDKAAEESGEYKSLYEGVKSKADAYDKHVEAVAGRNADRIEALPPEWKAAIPGVLMAEPLALSEWLDATKALRAGPAAATPEGDADAPNRPAGTMSGSAAGGGDDIPAEAAKDAIAAGKTPEEWWKIMKHSKRYAKK